MLLKPLCTGPGVKTVSDLFHKEIVCSLISSVPGEERCHVCAVEICAAES